MTTVIAYILLCLNSPGDLQYLVNSKLKEGYVPEGGISVSVLDKDAGGTYCQAMDRFVNN